MTDQRSSTGSESVLLPCPFCTCKAVELETIAQDAFCVECPACGACGPEHFTASLATKSWNERTGDVAQGQPSRGVMEATAAQHFDLPKGKPAQFVRNGKLETCRCLDCRDLAQAAQPEPDAWQWRYVGDLDWKTPSGGTKLPDHLNERPIEQRPLYAAPQPLEETVKDEMK